jgi:hypothetical protein
MTMLSVRLSRIAKASATSVTIANDTRDSLFKRTVARSVARVFVALQHSAPPLVETPPAPLCPPVHPIEEQHVVVIRARYEPYFCMATMLAS